MDKFYTTTGMVLLGYRDYIAARHLINNEFYMQGLYLASSAVEKYLKAVIVNRNSSITDVRKIKFHLDRFNELEKLFRGWGDDLLSKLDRNFLHILGVAYDLRYYDSIQKSNSIGFLVNQFLWELDYTVFYIETGFWRPGDSWLTAYGKAHRAKYSELYDNNSFLENKDKKEVMESKSRMYCLLVHRDMYILHREFKTKDVVHVRNYDGKIAYATLSLEQQSMRKIYVEFTHSLANLGHFDLSDFTEIHY